MKQQVTDAIVLRRVNYGEADRIVTLLTPSDGKLALVARGVRRPKSKLAGGIELLSISSVTYAGGRSGGLGTLVSARLEQHFGNIVKDLARVQLGYELLQTTDKITEDQPEPEYFTLLATGLAALNMPEVPVDLIKVWF
ncbi:MAG TPA: DNA repair protein RecO, partial [Candidatus Saccharibacteria bacterium]|nr:DNA repair protein RecO [Candidatus Saccharibacteria bacterium]